MFKNLAVKRFERSAADKEVNLPQNIRPPVILRHVLSFLRDCIADQDRIPANKSFFKYKEQGQTSHLFTDIYSYIRDRTRQIAQELVVINANIDIHTIRTTEEICRFLIISYHDGFQQDNGFEVVQNTERLTENLSRLQESYKTVKLRLQRNQLSLEQAKELLQNEAEFTSYSLIVTDSVRGVQQILGLDLSSQFYTQADILLIKQAIKIQRIIIATDFTAFFGLIRKSRTNYMFACLMLTQLQSMRLEAV